MPIWLGRILMIGGVAYLVSAYLGYVMAEGPAWLVDALAIPATIGELWMIAYLLVVGIRKPLPR